MRETIPVHDGQAFQKLPSNDLDFLLGSLILQVFVQRAMLEVLHGNVDVGFILKPPVKLNEQILMLETSQPREV
jgi:hypothetical protein